MNKLLFALVAGLLVAVVFFVPSPALAGFSFEDPQLCVNGELLKVIPTKDGAEVWVSVPANAVIDYNVVNCGGNPEQPVIEESHVKYNADGPKMKVLVVTDPHTLVLLDYDGKTFLKQSGQGKVTFTVKVAK